MYRTLIALPFVLLPFFFGGIQPWHQAFVFSLFLISFIFVLFSRQGLAFPSLASKWSILLGLILVYPFFQAVPLPLSWLQTLSPERFFWLCKAGEITSLDPTWTSLSYTPLQTVFAGFRWVFIALFALVFYRFLGEKEQVHWLIKLLFFIALGEALYGLMQALVPSLHVLWSDEEAYMGCARGTFINRNHFACFLNLLWPLLLAYLLTLSSKLQTGHSKDGLDPEKKEQLRHKQIFFGFLIVIVLLSLVFSKSRAGIASSLVALTVFVVLLRSKRKELLIFVAGCWGGMLAYGWIIGFEEILHRFDLLLQNIPGRSRIWQDSLSIIQDYLFLGSGVDSFLDLFRLYQTHLSESKWICHAHSDYLELTAELGVPVAGGLVVFGWGYWLHKAWQVFRRAKLDQSPELMLAAGALAGVAAFFAHGLVEFNWQIPANQLYFVIMLVLAQRFLSRAK